MSTAVPGMDGLQLFTLRGVMLPLLITFVFGYPSQAQYSANQSRDLDSSLFQSQPYSSFPSPARNVLRHGYSKLNSSVSFGINESDIAAIFRGVAYGVTSAYSEAPISSPTTVTTETSTPSTTTTTTSSTTTTPTTTISTTDFFLSSPSFPFENEHNYFNSNNNRQHNIRGNNDGQMIQDSGYHSSAEKINIPTPSNIQHYPPFDHHTKQVEDNNIYSTDGIYRAGENVHLRESQGSIYGRRQLETSPRNNIEMHDVEVQHQVVDYAWVIHVYLTGVLMGVVAAMAICCISRIHFCAEFFPRKFYVTMHVLVFLAAFLRCILLFNGSFGEANSKLPKVLTELLINSVPPFLTAAFALVLLVFLNGTNLALIPSKYQSSFVLTVISIAHIVASVTIDICAGLSDSASVINALRAGVQAITAGWGILLCLGFIYLIAHLWKNEDKRASIPKKSLQVIYVAVSVELILACFTIYGIVTPRATKYLDNDNTWSLWVLASCERLLEACFCVTLLVITTTFTLNKCNGNAKPQEQRGFGGMSTGKREGGVLKKSANVYPVTSDKGGFLPTALFAGNLDTDSGPKSHENIYSGWLDAKYAGTIDSTTSDFQLLAGKGGNSTMSTVVYPNFGTITTGDSGDDSTKDSYISHGPESSTTSYSTLSSYRQMNPTHLCYCGPVATCCPTPVAANGAPGFPGVTKQPVLLVSQYSHPQQHKNIMIGNVQSGSGPLSEESSSGSSYYGSSLGSSHIYSSPQYYTCPSQHQPPLQGSPQDVAEVHVTRSNNVNIQHHLHKQLLQQQQVSMLPGHLHQCSEIPNIIQGQRHQHIPTASLPILENIPEMNKRIIQYRPQQPLPIHQHHQQEMHCLKTGEVDFEQQQQQLVSTPLGSPLRNMHQNHQLHNILQHPHAHHFHPHHIQQQQHQVHVTATTPHNGSIRTEHQHAPSKEASSPSVTKDCKEMPSANPRTSKTKNSPTQSPDPNNTDDASYQSTSATALSPLGTEGRTPVAIHSIEGSDCSFLNKLVKSPEGQSLSSSLELDTKRLSVRRTRNKQHQQQHLQRQHMALTDDDLPSQIV